MTWGRGRESDGTRLPGALCQQQQQLQWQRHWQAPGVRVDRGNGAGGCCAAGGDALPASPQERLTVPLGACRTPSVWHNAGSGVGWRCMSSFLVVPGHPCDHANILHSLCTAAIAQSYAGSHCKTSSRGYLSQWCTGDPGCLHRFVLPAAMPEAVVLVVS
jgi:hypothetical protein